MCPDKKIVDKCIDKQCCVEPAIHCLFSFPPKDSGKVNIKAHTYTHKLVRQRRLFIINKT